MTKSERKRFNAQVGLFVRALRAKRGWLQNDLAREMGLSRTSLSNIEHGRHPGVKAETLFLIARALRCNVASLIPDWRPSRG